MAERSAVLLISHGSRQRHATVFTNDLAAALRRDDPERIVAVSFLELNQPSPAEALRQLIAGGTIDIQSGQGRGTTVRITLMMPPGESEG